jgi:hypothetical protein
MVISVMCKGPQDGIIFFGMGTNTHKKGLARQCPIRTMHRAASSTVSIHVVLQVGEDDIIWVIGHQKPWDGGS